MSAKTHDANKKEKQQEYLGTLEALNSKLEAVCKERDQLCEENAALAAHVERISACRLESGRIGIWSLNNALKETPATSLARRDLLNQAKGADLVAREFEGEYGDYLLMINNVADRLRQQAQEAQP